MTPQRMHMANSHDPAADRSALPPSAAALLRRRERVLGAPYRLFYEEPLEAVRGEGALLFDAAGRDHLDVYNNVPAVGHSNRRGPAGAGEDTAEIHSPPKLLCRPFLFK